MISSSINRNQVPSYSPEVQRPPGLAKFKLLQGSYGINGI